MYEKTDSFPCNVCNKNFLKDHTIRIKMVKLGGQNNIILIKN
jgi:hypothetical protein